MMLSKLICLHTLKLRAEVNFLQITLSLLKDDNFLDMFVCSSGMTCEAIFNDCRGGQVS
jgi:hypothetical protein